MAGPSKVGLIGCGQISGIYIETAQRMDDIEVIACADVVPEAVPEDAVTTTEEVPASFNPIVRLQWPAPEKLYIKTAYVRLLSHDTINTFQRWHLIVLSPQAAILK